MCYFRHILTIFKVCIFESDFGWLKNVAEVTGCTAACHWRCTAPQRVSPKCNIRSSIFWIVWEFASMLLILTLIYLLHGFQSHAVFLTSILEESSSNSTVISIPACICPHQWFRVRPVYSAIARVSKNIPFTKKYNVSYHRSVPYCFAL